MASRTAKPVANGYSKSKATIEDSDEEAEDATPADETPANGSTREATLESDGGKMDVDDEDKDED